MVFFYDEADPTSIGAHGGSLIGRFITSSTRVGGALVQAMTLCPGRTYSFAGFFRQVDKLNACQIMVSVVNDLAAGYPTVQSGTIINAISTTNSGDWEALSGVRYTVPSGASSATVALQVDFYCSGTPDNGYYTMDIDDLSFSQV